MQKNNELVYELICLFVARQRLVFQALKELRPQILASTGAIDRQQPEPRKSIFDIPQTGYWGVNQEWKYFIHGLGCKLVHVTTQEPIEWNAPNPKSFDKYWFINWLKWYVNHAEDRERIRFLKSMNSNAIADFVLSALLKFEESELVVRLSTQYNNEYTLV
ncbi:MAG: hypothetical protein K8L99_26020 [Anaerolineae bacterium]|nr:hypothetical protein [Anaerolineae bacterium]